MGNFKVKVRAETKEQSDEIQKLANSIGIFRNYSNWVLHKGWVCLDGNEILLVCDSCLGGEEDFKTITLPELRTMVNPSLKDQYLEQGKKINDACASVFKKQDDLLTAMLDHSAMSINDQYAEIEQVRQAIKVPDGNDSDHAADAMAYAFMGVGRDKVRQTLNERQSQYGDFKDVADTTQKLMATLMGNTGYSCVQVEALHMICSKLARIANGDPNHVDSWHDISGYATLVVDDLES